MILRRRSSPAPQPWLSLRECRRPTVSGAWSWPPPYRGRGRCRPDCPWQWSLPRCTAIVTAAGSGRGQRCELHRPPAPSAAAVAPPPWLPPRIMPGGGEPCEATVPRATHRCHLFSALPRSAEPPAPSSLVRPSSSNCAALLPLWRLQSPLRQPLTAGERTLNLKARGTRWRAKDRQGVELSLSWPDLAARPNWSYPGFGRLS